MVKLGRNDKCPCQSGKKYKKCCLIKDQQDKLIIASQFSDGHELSSDNVKKVHEYLVEEYKDHKVIDVTNILNDDTYKPMQTANYNKSVIMIAERNNTNENIFSSRGPENVNLMVMYRGAYQCFEDINFELAQDKINSMILTRLTGKDI